MDDLDLFFGTGVAAPSLNLQLVLTGIDVGLGVLKRPPLKTTEVACPGAANATVLCVVSVLDPIHVILPALGTLRCGVKIAGSHQLVMST